MSNGENVKQKKEDNMLFWNSHPRPERLIAKLLNDQY